MRGISFTQKGLDKKTAVAVSTRRAALKAKDTTNAYFCSRAFTVFCVLFTARFKFAFSRRGFGRVKFEAEIYKFSQI